MSGTNGYHHGQIIRTFRQNKGWTIAELAEHWPTGPVSWRYVQRVETGEKQIADQRTLRALSETLDIPLWHFGLSEYNPFTLEQLPGRGNHMFDETMDATDQIIEQTWYMRRVAPVPETLKNIRRLISLFSYFTKYLPPPATQEKRFLRSLAQVRRLNAILLIELGHYPEALASFRAMHQIAQELNEPATTALALMGIGVEMERAGFKQEAVTELEEARDHAMRASRQITGLVSSYLARAYASSHDAVRFHRTIDTAQAIAENLGANYGDGTDYVYHRLSGVLAERSWGYLDIGEPHQTLKMRERIIGQIEVNQNTWLYAWMPLDWARALLMLGEVEESINAALDFYQRAQLLQSPHAMKAADAFAFTLEERGYRNLPAVQSFLDELRQRKPYS